MAKNLFQKGNKICLGKKLSEEHKNKISLSLIGNKRTLGHKLSKEHKKKIGIKMNGREIKWKDKISRAHRGKAKPWIRGEKHPQWKGGITSLAEQIRKSFKYRQWRSDVFTRDDFTCQMCKKKGCYLEADHYPKMFSLILEEYKIVTLEGALICEELWNINNGRTLCRKCHSKHKIHKKYY